MSARLERHQVWIYLGGVLLGLGVGSLFPGLAPFAEGALWPLLALLLYVTMVQIPLLHLGIAWRDRAFLLASGLGNFVLIPAIVIVALRCLPLDPAIHLGLVLVLLVPCTDWFITFAQLGRGDAARALAVSPLNLLLQLLLLPLYLGLALPQATLQAMLAAPTLLAGAMAVLGVPLIAALATERWVERAPQRRLWRARLAVLTVPLLAAVVFVIAAAQVNLILDTGTQLLAVVPGFVAYLVLALGLAAGLGRGFRLALPARRTLAYGFGTRNSFVVLPLALALPQGWELAAVVIVLQALVELIGMAAYLLLVPRLFSDPRP